MEEEDVPGDGSVIVRRPKCACNTACPDTLQPVCASDGNTVSECRMTRISQQRGDFGLM